MREELANVVFPFLSRVLDLRDRLDRGAPLVFETEQATLKSMLLSESEARRWSDFGGEEDRTALLEGTGDGGVGGRGAFLGVRYALVCLADELFLFDSPWQAAWNERKLESTLYGTNDRAWRFWEQAQRAEALASTDALEAFYYCVMLGFRGELVQRDDRLRAWIAETREKLLASTPRWLPPAEVDPVTRVPPLLARERLRRVLVTGGALLVLLATAITFIIVRHLS